LAGRASDGEIRLVRVLFDTNVVLDLLLARAPFEQEAKGIWDALDEERIIGFVPASALTDVFYIARKQVGREMALDAVQTCFDSL
jgi:predicted nucleic acid-binding protein